MKTYVCENCKTPFNRRRKLYKRTFCTTECYNAWMLANRTIEKTCKECGKTFRCPKCYERRFSTCSKQCQCNSRKREKNVKWNDGLSDTKKRLRKNDMETRRYRGWRKEVFSRDNFTCRHCGVRGGALHAHHINSYDKFPEQRYDVANGQTLCVPCHRKTYKTK